MQAGNWQAVGVKVTGVASVHAPLTLHVSIVVGFTLSLWAKLGGGNPYDGLMVPKFHRLLFT